MASMPKFVLLTCLLSSTAHLFRPFFKKRGGGKGDWGSPGDELLDCCPMDPRDPLYEDAWSDAELEAALIEHLYPEDRAQSPLSEEDTVMAKSPELDCDFSKGPAAFFGSSDSPKGSWLHTFSDPTPLKLPANAVWPVVPREDVSTSFFFD
jgi:hypothetical protein